MKRFLLILVLGTIGKSTSIAQTPSDFSDPKLNLNQKPRLREFQPNSPNDLTFRLGHVLFAYEPNAAFRSLVDQQLGQKQTFQFQKARLAAWELLGTSGR